ncbi:MAG: SMP-30/gluconolactonase/LRE family protein [Sphingomonadales bacterium]
MTRFAGLAMISGLALAVAACSPAAKSDTDAKPAAAATAAISIDKLDPALDSLIKPGELPLQIASGYRFVEGPLWLGDRLRFSDLMDNKLYELVDGQPAKLIMDKSGGLDQMAPDSFQGSNGAVVDKDGSVLMTQHGARRIVRLDDKMNATVFLDKANGKRLNSPNDLAFTPDGALWITDPPYGLVGQDKDAAKEQPYNAVWRYANGKATAVITDLPRPNGIGFSPDGKKLYISNSEPEMFVNVYDVNADGSVSKARRFITYPGPNPVDVPDGLKVDSAGNVWASGPGGIRIINEDGKVLGQIKTPDRAQANMIWGGDDLKTLYIMGAGNVYKLRTEVAGQKPLYAKAPAK